MIRKRREKLSRWLGRFERKGYQIVFMSRFVYGTRAMAQVLAGMTRLQFVRYASVNFAGSLIYLSIVTGLAVLVGRSLGALESHVQRGYVFFGMFLAVLVALRYLLHRGVRSKWIGEDGS